MKRSLENPNAAFVTMSVSPVLSLMRFFGSIFREYAIILSSYRWMNTTSLSELSYGWGTHQREPVSEHSAVNTRLLKPMWVDGDTTGPFSTWLLISVYVDRGTGVLGLRALSSC